jgi:hypothetical protein
MPWDIFTRKSVTPRGAGVRGRNRGPALELLRVLVKRPGRQQETREMADGGEQGKLCVKTLTSKKKSLPCLEKQIARWRQEGTGRTGTKQEAMKAPTGVPVTPLVSDGRGRDGSDSAILDHPDSTTHCEQACIMGSSLGLVKQRG